MLTIKMTAGRLYVREHRIDARVDARVDYQEFYVSGSSGNYSIQHSSDTTKASVYRGTTLIRHFKSNGEVTSNRHVSNVYLYDAYYTTREATPEEYAWIKTEHQGFANMFPELFNSIPNHTKQEHYAYY